MIDYKQDKGKVDLTFTHLDCSRTLEGCAAIMEDAHKRRGYPRNGFKDLIGSEDRLMAACYRHMSAMAENRLALDTDSGKPHILHAITNLMMLHEYLLKHGKHPQQETPAPASPVPEGLLRQLTQWLMEDPTERSCRLGSGVTLKQQREQGLWILVLTRGARYTTYSRDKALKSPRAALVAMLEAVAP